MLALFDTHAHYDDSAFDADREDLLHQFEKSVVGIINCGTDLKTSKVSIRYAATYRNIWAAVGIHPSEIGQAPVEELEELRRLSQQHKKVVAIGEIGLDYHYGKKEDYNHQRQWFEKQLLLANEQHLPVIVHDRDAHADTLHYLKSHRPKGVIHCFSGSKEMAEEVISLGLYIGIGGAVTFKNSKKVKEVAQAIPLDRLLLETDAPYMAPEPYRSKRCESRYIAYTAQKIAELRGTTVEEIVDAALTNAKRLFGIHEREETDDHNLRI